MGHPDEELMNRWRRGDSSAFEEIVRRWQQPIGRFLARQMGRMDCVQDLSQEVFLKVYQAGDRYRETGAFSTWLYRIALNVARDAGRRRLRLPEALANVDPQANGTSSRTRCEQQELQQAMASALADLPGPLREVLVLRHYEGMNFEEISRLLDTPASTLKSRFALALVRLRDQLHQRGFGREEMES